MFMDIGLATELQCENQAETREEQGLMNILVNSSV